VIRTGEVVHPCRLRYSRSTCTWGLSIYPASHIDNQPSVLHTGHTAARPEDALHTASGLYLNDPTAWTEPPKN
jgi:hypothetical protein